RARHQPARLFAALRHLPRLRSGGAHLARDAAAVSLHRRQAARLARGAAPVKRAAALLAALAACAHSKAQQAPASTSKNGVEVQDAIHGVRYQLPPGADLLQVSREGAARSTSGAEVEVSTFPMGRPPTPAQCRENARSRLGARRDSRAAAPADAPRDESSAD